MISHGRQQLIFLEAFKAEKRLVVIRRMPFITFGLANKWDLLLGEQLIEGDI